MADTGHVWRFLRSGGFDQVCIERGEDLRYLAELDPKLWTTLACPVKGLRFDANTLTYLDTDKDGRIRVPEVLAAVQFVLDALKNPDLVFGVKVLALGDVQDATPLGVRIQQSAQALRQMLHLADSEALTLEHVLDRSVLFPANHPNGDGVVPLEFTENPGLMTVLTAILEEEGQVIDRSGQPGVTAELLNQYFARVQQTLEWLQAEPRREGLNFPAIWPIFKEIGSKIDDYFARCQLLTFGGVSAECLANMSSQLEALNTQLIHLNAVEVRELPLAVPQAGASLDLDNAVNPAWQDTLHSLVLVLVQPVLGEVRSLSLSQWKQLGALMGQYESWLLAEPAGRVRPEYAQLQQWVDQGVQMQIQALIDRDLQVQEAADAIMEVDKLLHFQRYLVDFLNNFVTLRDFYRLKNPAMFQAGRLYLDQRSCDLCVDVADFNQHVAVAGLSRTYLVYCQLKRINEPDRIIVAAVTAGDAGNIMMGRHAVFYDHEGRDWDATVIRLIENPISVREAFWTPYRKFGQMLSDQLQKMAKAREQLVEKSAMKDISGTMAVAGTVPLGAATPSAMDIGRFAGIFAAIGLAIGAIGTALASMVTGLLSLHWWQIPLVPASLVLLISGPSMIIAWFKLHARNLGPILEGNGWAINTHARINIIFGTALTQLAVLPKASERSLRDTYAPRRPVRYRLVVGVLLAVVAVVLGIFCKYSASLLA